jgi:hypothetical protein
MKSKIYCNIEYVEAIQCIVLDWMLWFDIDSAPYELYKKWTYILPDVFLHHIGPVPALAAVFKQHQVAGVVVLSNFTDICRN